MSIQSPQPLTILLVEDNPADVRFFQEILAEISLPTTLRIANDGEHALAILRQVNKESDAPIPDIVFLDIHLPKKNGHEVLAEINADATLHHLPVWVFVAEGDDPAKELIETQGLTVAGYLIKPIGIDLLTKVLASARQSL